ncbi:MAG: hypothetical protein ACRC1V_06750, partial [Plesiomonas sp.]
RFFSDVTYTPPGLDGISVVRGSMKKSAKNAQNLSIITNIQILRIAESSTHPCWETFPCQAQYAR